MNNLLLVLALLMVTLSGCATSHYAYLEKRGPEEPSRLIERKDLGYDFDALELHPAYLHPDRSLRPVGEDLIDLW